MRSETYCGEGKVKWKATRSVVCEERRAVRRSAALRRMRTGAIAAASVLVLFWLCLPTAAAQSAAVQAALARIVAAAERGHTPVVRGRGHWLFFTPELRHLAAGPFWGAAAKRVSASPNPDWADPLPAILDFKKQLDRAGITLLIAPVPEKAAVYPERLSSALSSAERIDHADAAFYQVLRARGVRVLDLEPLFYARRNAGAALFLTGDTHWSGAGCDLAAAAIARAVGRPAWIRRAPRHAFSTSSRRITVDGDLRQLLSGARPPLETVAITTVSERAGGRLEPVGEWRQSPVLLLGDSYDLVFHAGGDMLATGAGLPDELAAQLGFPVDVVAVRGSGATPARVNLLRRRDNLAGKKLVIWCFAAREFTQAEGWRKVPVIR